MIFNEVYGAYYNTVAQVLGKAVKGELTEKTLRETVKENAYRESVIELLPKLTDGSWPLINKDMTTPIKHVPEMPLTLLQKRWLRSLLDDPRIRLFDIKPEGLEDIEPLFSRDAVEVFDKYSDGDPYESEIYIEHFRTALTAVREKKILAVEYVSGKGIPHFIRCLPYRMEYSEKDDKFRLMTCSGRRGNIINIARITRCRLTDTEVFGSVTVPEKRKSSFTVIMTDERNVVERAMIHFSHFEKLAERLDDKTYKLTVTYDIRDETELLIRVLSFGQFMTVIEPESFAELVKERIARQLRLLEAGHSDGGIQL